ncbi:hypothetical protein IJ096_01020 [Candidatus Saccharibacteria bacterium]|nr:hypothetical protein [Candidatus Saccharibacteria bacterium]
MDKIKEIINKILGGKVGDTDKRIRISKAQREMLLATAATSVVFGVCIVLSVHFVQYSLFYGEVLTKEDKSIDNYQQSIIKSGACVDSNNDGSISDVELEVCEPSITPLKGDTLRTNVAVNMASNESLDSVNRKYISVCYKDRDPNNGKVDYAKLYSSAATVEDRNAYLSMIQVCSALRTIPDALPAQLNVEALMASVNAVLIQADWVPESLSPGDASGDTGDDGDSEDEASLGTSEVSLAVEGSVEKVSEVLKTTEKSIRTFEPKTASVSWSSAGVELNTQLDAFYTSGSSIKESTITVNASKKKGSD